MPMWSNCCVQVRCWDEDDRFECEDCDVRLEDGTIVISYFDEEGPVVFAGEDDPSGHYHLVCRSRPRKATLHRFEGGTTFEGSWTQGDERGFWRIVLSDDSHLDSIGELGA